MARLRLGARTARSALVALLAAAALAGCGDDDDRLDAGEVVAAGQPAADGGSEVSVTVPTGTLDLHVSDPAEEVGDHRAPEGGSLVRVDVDFHDAQVRRDVWALAAREGVQKPVTLAVEVGGSTYDVGTVRRGNAPEDQDADVVPQDFVVAVDEDADADDMALVVGYDGLAQTVHTDGSRDPGPADALYDDAPDPVTLPTASCAEGDFSGPVEAVGFRCEVGSVRSLPYLPDLGWAEEGQGFLVLNLGAAVDQLETSSPDGTYAVAAVEDRTTLAGQRPDAVIDPATTAGGAQYTSQLAFDVPTDTAGQLDVALAYTLRLVGGDGPAARDLTYTTTVDLASAGLTTD